MAHLMQRQRRVAPTSLEEVRRTTDGIGVAAPGGDVTPAWRVSGFSKEATVCPAWWPTPQACRRVITRRPRRAPCTAAAPVDGPLARVMTHGVSSAPILGKGTASIGLSESSDGEYGARPGAPSLREPGAAQSSKGTVGLVMHYVYLPVVMVK